MSSTVCIATPPHTLMGSGNAAHLWIFMNWALGLHAIGSRVFWLEDVSCMTDGSTRDIETAITDIRDRLRPLDLADDVVLTALKDNELLPIPIRGAPDLDDALQADLLINFFYAAPATFVKRFQRSVLIDLDPGQLQIWMSRGQINVAPHDLYFTIGETVGTSSARFPDCGLRWQYIAPPVFLPAWPVVRADSSAPYTTVTGWWDKWMEVDGEMFSNEKRSAFLRYLQLAPQVPRKLELCIILDEFTRSTDRLTLEQHGWNVRDARDICTAPERFRDYVQKSWGEFTCARPSCSRLSSAWVSDRTLCYLASGKPAVVEYTAPSRYSAEGGLFRFKTPEQALSSFNAIESDYERHCHLAREIAEEYFDAKKVAQHVVEQASA